MRWACARNGVEHGKSMRVMISLELKHELSSRSMLFQLDFAKSNFTDT